MDCNELVEVITDYLEGTLPDADRVRFDSHLEECPFCVIYVAQMRATLSTLGSVPTETISPQARDELLRAFRDWKKSG